MKKILFTLLCLPLLFGCGNQQSQVTEDTVVEDALLKKTQFIISDEFVLADDETLSSYLKETISELNMEEFSKDKVKLSDEGWEEVMLEWKETSSLYLRKNNFDNGENIIVKYSEIAPSESWLNKLTAELKQQEAALLQTTGMSFRLIDSEMGKYKNKHSYMLFTSIVSFEEISRYSLQCIISINNKSYQIISNTYDKLLLEDVIIDIK